MIVAAQYGTVSDIEILWVVIAIIGFLVSAWNFWQAHLDCRALKTMKEPNGRRLIAKASRFQDATRMSVHAIFITIGLLAMTQKDVNNELLTDTQLALRFSITWGLVLGAVLLVTQSMVARNLRIRLLSDERHNIKNEMLAEQLTSDLKERGMK